MAAEEAVYNGRDNAIEIELLVDLVRIDHRDISRALVIVAGRTLDSAINPDWIVLGAPDRIVLRLGHAGLAAGRQVAQLVTYDAANPNGLAWEPELVLRVKG